jgi:hypothetical protein
MTIYANPPAPERPPRRRLTWRQRLEAIVAWRRRRADQRLAPHPPSPRQREFDLQIEHTSRLWGQ